MKNLFNGLQEQGSYTVSWDGTSNLGQIVTSGIYLLKVSEGSSVALRQLTLLR